MGVESVKGPHPGYNRTLEGIVVFRAIQRRGRCIPKVGMHIHNTAGVISNNPEKRRVKPTDPGMTHEPFKS